MGMAASQVRFLSLQNRKNTIGLNLMTLSNRKTALSRDMNRVAAEYNNAMNQKVLKWSGDSGVTYNDIDYDSLMKPNELNATLPYIVTDAQGRVVVDDNNIVFDGKDTGVSYRQLATLISAYSGIDDNGNTTYNKTGNVFGLDPNNDSVLVGDNIIPGTAGTKMSDAYEYKVVSNYNDYNYKNKIRYDLMSKLGLIREEDKTIVQNIYDSLYGKNPTTYDSQNYYVETAKNKDVIGIQGEEFDTDAFGVMKYSQGSLILDDASLYGNYNLAQQYLKEFELYLNTPIKVNLSGDNNSEFSKVTNEAYKYDEEKSITSGITQRIASLLKLNNPGGTDNTTDNVNNTGLYLETLLSKLGTVSANKLYSDTYQENDSNAVGVYLGTDGKKSYKDSTELSWSDLYNGQDGKKYFVTIQSYKTKSNDRISGDMGALDPLVNSFKQAVSTANQGLPYNVEAADFAYYMTMVKFGNNKELLKATNGHASGSYEAIKENVDSAIASGKDDNTLLTSSWGRGRGDDEGYKSKDNASSINGVSTYRDTKPDNQEFAVSISSVMDTFMTFYSAYIESMIDGTGVPVIDWYSNNKLYAQTIGQNGSGETVDFMTDAELGLLNKTNTEQVFTNGKGGTYITEFDVNYDNYPSPATVGLAYEQNFVDDNHDDIDDLTGYNEDSFNLLVKYSQNPDGRTELIDYLTTNGLDTDERYKDLYEDLTLEGQEEDMYDILIALTKRVKCTSQYNVVATTIETYALSNGTATKETTYKNGKCSEINVTFKYNDGVDTDGLYKLYKATYDESGNFVSAELVLNSEKDSTNETLKKLTEGDGNEQLEAYIKAGNNVYGLANTIGKSTYAKTSYILPTDPSDIKGQLTTLINNLKAEIQEKETQLQTYYASLESRGMDYFDAIFKMIAENGWVYDENVNNPTKKEDSKNYLNAKLQNNMLFITEVNTLDGQDFNYATKLAMNVSKVFQVYDTDAQNVALSKYESEKADITAKEKVIDIRMNKLEAEQDAISTELDSIKQIIKDNVDKTFKIFT